VPPADAKAVVHESGAAVKAPVGGTGEPAAAAGSLAMAGPNGVRAQVVTQLLAQRIAGGNERVTLQLEPAHLGKLEVELRVQNGRLTVVFAAESSDVERALHDGADELVEALLQRGGRWSEVEVRSQREADDGRPRDQNHDRERRGGEDSDRDRERRDRRERRQKRG